MCWGAGNCNIVTYYIKTATAAMENHVNKRHIHTHTQSYIVLRVRYKIQSITRTLTLVLGMCIV